MRADEITTCLKELDRELQAQAVKGELCLYGGTVMCLVYQARPDTRDVDAIFQPAQVIRQAAVRVARRLALPEDWLNDAVKGFVVPHARQVLFEFDNLAVYTPVPDYLLAMKCLAARADTSDRDDIRVLLKRLGITQPEQVFAILRQYYPDQNIRPVTRFLIEEMLAP
jgi:hypothetical protein